MTDTVGDMLIRIKNAYAVKHEAVKIPYSNLRWSIAEVLEREGYIEKAEKKGRKDHRIIEIALKYVDGEPAIRELRRISKPGRRIYVKRLHVGSRRAGRRIVLSTSNGVVTDKEAKKLGVGGEALFEIW